MEKVYPDGLVYEITGSAVFPMRYEYGVENSQEYRKEIKLNGTSETEWTKSFKDAAGHWYKTVHSGSGSPTTIAVYNNKGQMIQQTDPDNVVGAQIN